MQTVIETLQGVPWWYWAGGMYYLLAFAIDDLRELNGFPSVTQQVKEALTDLFYSVLILSITLVALVVHLLFWPVLVVTRSALKTRKRNTQNISHLRVRRQSAPEFNKQWMEIKGQRRFIWQRGRWHVMGRWLPEPEYQLFDYVKAKRSVLSGPSLVLNFIVVNLGITRLPAEGTSTKEFS